MANDESSKGMYWLLGAGAVLAVGAIAHEKGYFEPEYKEKKVAPPRKSGSPAKQVKAEKKTTPRAAKPGSWQAYVSSRMKNGDKMADIAADWRKMKNS